MQLRRTTTCPWWRRGDRSKTNKQKKTALYLRREVDEEEKRFLSILREGSKAITQNISLL